MTAEHPIMGLVTQFQKQRKRCFCVTFIWIHSMTGFAKDVEGSMILVQAEVRWELAGSLRTGDPWREAEGPGGF